MYTALFLFLTLSIIVSFLCSMWEAVLLSISPSYMQTKVNEGHKIGKVLQDFKDNIDRPLSAILTLNTIAHTVGAIGVGKEATKIWAETSPLMTGIIVPVLMTAAILIFSEIIPKTIGATKWRLLAPFTVRSLRLTIIALLPIIWLCQIVTRLFQSKKGESIFTRSDFLAMAQIGTEEGHLDPMEAEFIHNLMHFKKYKVREVMTPRTVIFSAPQEMTFKEFYNSKKEHIFSRVPLRESATSDNIIGFVLKDDVLDFLVHDEDHKKLSEIRRDIIIVQHSYSIFQLFTDFITKREHIALVVDEYGSTQGIVTMEDVVETLLGSEIVDETDQVVDMQDHAKKNWARLKIRNTSNSKSGKSLNKNRSEPKEEEQDTSKLD